MDNTVTEFIFVALVDTKIVLTQPTRTRFSIWFSHVHVLKYTDLKTNFNYIKMMRLINTGNDAWTSSRFLFLHFSKTIQQNSINSSVGASAEYL